MTAVLEVESLQAGYNHVPAVRDFSITIQEGEIVALLGPNGAGKSTTLLAISNLVQRLGGTIRIDGIDVASNMAPHRVARLGCAHVTEERSLFLSLTVRENLLVNIKRTEIPSALKFFPALVPLLDRRAGLLSGGEQQMLAMARSLAARPRLLMIDELSLGLAPMITRTLLDIVRTASIETGCAVLLVEQHASLALGIAARGQVMSRGRVTLTGSAEEMLHDRSLLESSYLGERSEANVATGSEKTANYVAS